MFGYTMRPQPREDGKTANCTKKGPGRFHPAPEWLTEQRKREKAEYRRQRDALK